MKPYAHDDRVMVSPRYMAGAGDRIADVIGPLIRLFEWNHQRDAATGHVAIDSPDSSLFVDFAPLHPLGRWLTVAHHEPYWEVTFSRQAPLEAVAAVTQALPQLLGDPRHADRIPITDMPLDQIAELNGWSTEDSALTSPTCTADCSNRPPRRSPGRSSTSTTRGHRWHLHARHPGVWLCSQERAALRHRFGRR
ncbi:DUF317 domain-containing protein [Streptomyces sp. Pv4-95]|uniref:DUF317 domain-containing protein n=1 Tax=Streptomyces sp. Pv4-95 TaxID=3049543 RepID=UPI00389172C1